MKEDNYIKLLNQIKTDLEKWKKNTIITIRKDCNKQNEHPAKTTLSVPVKIEKKYFDDLNKVILKYTWQGKKARIKLKMLQESKETGGFVSPD